MFDKPCSDMRIADNRSPVNRVNNNNRDINWEFIGGSKKKVHRVSCTYNSITRTPEAKSRGVQLLISHYGTTNNCWLGWSTAGYHETGFARH